jgi:hypothetical protein
MCWLKTWIPWSVVVGGIYSPNHQSGRWGRLLSKGAPDSPVRHRTLSGAPATSPNHWGSTVGALTSGAIGRSGGAPDSHCSLSGAPSAPALTLRALSAHCSLLQTIVGVVSRCSAWHTGQSGATPDSPVNYSRELFPETQSWAVRVDSPWCTGHCPVVHRIVRCARLGLPSVSFAPFYLNPFLDSLLVCVEPLAPVELII